MNININLKSEELLRKFDGIYVHSAPNFIAWGPHLQQQEFEMDKPRK